MKENLNRPNKIQKILCLKNREKKHNIFILNFILKRRRKISTQKRHPHLHSFSRLYIIYIFKNIHKYIKCVGK